MIEKLYQEDPYFQGARALTNSKMVLYMYVVFLYVVHVYQINVNVNFHLVNRN